MRIYTLGTSHGDPTLTRFSSSTAYEANDGSLYLIDAGEPVLALMTRKGLNIKDVRACFITHMHQDHAGGLAGLMKQRIKYPQGEERPLIFHLPEENGIIALKNWLWALHEDADNKNLAYKVVDDGQIYDDENLTVTAYRTEHLRTKGRLEGDPCSFAYVLYFKKEDKTVLHTGDLCCDFHDYPSIAYEKHFDACLCEATHYQPDKVQEQFGKSKFDKLILIHVAEHWQDLLVNHIPQSGDKRLLSYFKDLPYPVMVAHDGDEFYI